MKRRIPKARCRAIIVAAFDPGALGKSGQADKLGEIGEAQRLLSEIELELAKIKRENTAVKMERELLNKG